MKTEDILSNLCAYDPRNPNVSIDYDTGKPYDRPENCSCDNCFYGRTRLAEYILELTDLNTTNQ